jgi:hypothetical protein
MQIYSMLCPFFYESKKNHSSSGEVPGEGHFIKLSPVDVFPGIPDSAHLHYGLADVIRCGEPSVRYKFLNRLMSEIIKSVG